MRLPEQLAKLGRQQWARFRPSRTVNVSFFSADQLTLVPRDAVDVFAAISAQSEFLMSRMADKGRTAIYRRTGRKCPTTATPSTSAPPILSRRPAGEPLVIARTLSGPNSPRSFFFANIDSLSAMHCTQWMSNMRVFSDLANGALRVAAGRIWPRHAPHILIAAMPKTASSFLATAVAGLPGMSQKSITYSGNRREYEIDLPRLARRAGKSFVAQHHTRYSRETGEMLDAFNVLPVVTTRDVFDVVASLRDYVREQPVWPWAYVAQAHTALPDAELETMIADLMIPWYLAFYLSWLERPDALWAPYEKIRTEPELLVAEIAERAGIRASDADIETAVNRARDSKNRFNKGIPGRGHAICLAARERVLQLVSHYPDVDFTPLGVSEIAS